LNFIILGRSIKCFGSSEVRFSLKLDQFLQDWNSSVHNSPKAFNHRIFKTDFKFEEYFNILDEQNSLLLCKFRTTNHKLSIEKEQSYYNGQYMYLFTQQLYIINRSKEI
jgi:hypothetical protein